MILSARDNSLETDPTEWLGPVQRRRLGALRADAVVRPTWRIVNALEALMNIARLALAAVAASLVDGIYGFAVYGNALSSQFAAYPAVFRSAESGAAALPIMFCGILVGMLAVTYVYAKGYEGGSGFIEGLRFGLLIGIFDAGYFIGVDYGILNIGRRLALMMALAGVVEWLVVGCTIGLVYRSAAGAGAGIAKPAKV
jgi:hypothetical protein